MNESKSDALVFFGAIGDLADKQIFPALQALAKRGLLDLPVVGVAKSGWNLDQLRQRARQSLEDHGAIDPILGNRTPVHEYETGSWGPREAEAIAADIGGWRNPAASHND